MWVMAQLWLLRSLLSTAGTALHTVEMQQSTVRRGMRPTAGAAAAGRARSAGHGHRVGTSIHSKKVAQSSISSQEGRSGGLVLHMGTTGLRMVTYTRSTLVAIMDHTHPGANQVISYHLSSWRLSLQARSLRWIFWCLVCYVREFQRSVCVLLSPCMTWV